MVKVKNMKLYTACVKYFTDIPYTFTMENTFGETSDHNSSFKIVDDFELIIKTNLKDIINEYNHRFNYELNEDKILNKIEKYDEYTRNDGHIELSIKITEVIV